MQTFITNEAVSRGLISDIQFPEIFLVSYFNSVTGLGSVLEGKYLTLIL